MQAEAPENPRSRGTEGDGQPNISSDHELCTSVSLCSAPPLASRETDNPDGQPATKKCKGLDDSLKSRSTAPTAGKQGCADTETSACGAEGGGHDRAIAEAWLQEYGHPDNADHQKCIQLLTVLKKKRLQQIHLAQEHPAASMERAPSIQSR